jgi:hypothetical protein
VRVRPRFEAICAAGTVRSFFGQTKTRTGGSEQRDAAIYAFMSVMNDTVTQYKADFSVALFTVMFYDCLEPDGAKICNSLVRIERGDRMGPGDASGGNTSSASSTFGFQLI